MRKTIIGNLSASAVLACLLTSLNLYSADAPAPAEPPRMEVPKAEAAVDTVAKPGAGDAQGDAALQSGNPGYLADIAQVHLNYKFPERAELYARKAAEALKPSTDKPTTIRVRMLLAQVLDGNGDAKGSGEQFAAAAELAEPVTRSQLLLQYARLKVKDKDFAGALKVLTDAEQTLKALNEPNKAALLREVRRQETELARQDAGILDSMVAGAEAALKADPNDIAALERLSEIYSTVKLSPEKALPIQEKLAALQPNSVEVLSRLSTVYQQTNQIDKALDVSKKLVAAAPKEQKSGFAFQSAALLLQGGHKDEAKKFMEEAVGAEPSSHELNLLASIYEQAGDVDKADATLKKAAEHPQAQPSDKTLINIRRANICRVKKDYAGAETMLRAVMTDAAVDKNMQNYARTILTQLYREQGKEFKE